MELLLFIIFRYLGIPRLIFAQISRKDNTFLGIAQKTLYFLFILHYPRKQPDRIFIYPFATSTYKKSVPAKGNGFIFYVIFYSIPVSFFFYIQETLLLI